MTTPDQQLEAFPRRIYSGMAYKITEEFPDHPVADWAVTYYFQGPKGRDSILATETADGKYEISITSAFTGFNDVGLYKLTVVAVGLSRSEVLYEKRFEVLPDPTLELIGGDVRTSWEQIRDALIEGYQKWVSDPERTAVTSFTAGNRSYTFKSAAEWRQAIDLARWEVRREQRAAKLKDRDRRGHFGTHRVRFPG